MNLIQKPCLILTIVGALNWGLVGLFDFDLVKFITGNEINVFTRIIYVLVAIAGVVNILILFSNIRNPMMEVEEHHR
jgi:uncharacterized membrane protein YuzA (DUF378 family)